MPKSRLHQCLARFCPKKVTYAHLMCAAHWRLLPADMQNEIYLAHHGKRKARVRELIAQARDVVEKKERDAAEARGKAKAQIAIQAGNQRAADDAL